MMQCVRAQYTVKEVIKKSRFIGILQPCLDEIEMSNNLHECLLNYPDANHITFAYRIKTGNSLISRFHDGGEPSGTAGKPIFQHLEGKDLVNVLLTVIRYFGGIKLGAGGLTRAYGYTAKQVIERATFYPFVEYVETRIILDYRQMQSFEYHLKNWAGQITSQDFAEQIHLTIDIPKDNFYLLAQIYGQSISD